MSARSEPSLSRADLADVRRVVLVLGGHRSGTSALTRVISLLGASLPDNLMPATPDNPRGYWESLDLCRVNQGLMNAAGTRWYDDAPISDRWLRSEEVAAWRREALTLLEESFGTSCLLVLKDPRLCRLLPFWRVVFEDQGIAVSFLLIVRHPQEVFRSLAARRRLGFAGITSPHQSHLLWLRQVLETERQTRDLDRSILTYDRLLADWHATLSKVVSQTQISFPRSLEAASSEIEQFLSGRLKHQHLGSDDAPSDGYTLPSEVFALFSAHVDCGQKLDTFRLDEVRASLDRVEDTYSPLRAGSRLTLRPESPWSAEVLRRATEYAAPTPEPAPRVLYVSDRSGTRIHTYRVENRVASLQDGGIDASWVRLDEGLIERAEEADVVIVFRQTWCRQLERLYHRCRERGAPVGFDIDDLLFDPRISTAENLAFLRRATTEKRERFLGTNVTGLHRSLVESDFATVSTYPLARAARALGVRAYVLPNGLDAALIARAETVRGEAGAKPSGVDGLLRVGYASGTATHESDFATVAPVLAKMLDERPDLRLVVVGLLDLTEFPELEPHRAHIETRPKVPHTELLREYTRFDVNLAPLEIGNPFCEGKSELKYFEAALVQVPTVAAATEPYRTAIKDGETGFTATTPADWQERIGLLLDDPEMRTRLGRNAGLHAIAAFGPEAQSAAGRHMLLRIARDAELPLRRS